MATPVQKTEPRSHWSKDYIEHLRTVHFTLVVACIALVVLITSDHRSAVSNAREELNGIRRIVRNWDAHWIEKEAAHAFDGSKLPVDAFAADPNVAEIAITTRKGSTDVVRLSYDHPNWMLNTNDDSLHSVVFSRYPYPLDTVPVDLKNFHVFWDSLAKGLSFKVPVELDNPIVYEGAHPMPVQFISGVETGDHINVTLSTRTIESDDVLSDYPKGLYVTNIPIAGKTIVAIPVKRYESVRFDPYTRFIPANADWRRGTFAETFPDLSEITKNYEKLDFETLDKILEAEESRTGDSFEAIGIKFPAEGVTRWGLLLILGIQLYLFLHLEELTPKLKPSDEGWEVAWIGVYKSDISRALYFASTILLPATVAFALAYRMPTLTRTAWWLRLVALLLGAALSLLLGLLAWIRLRKNLGSE
jgi:hypothetical protein